jgi:DNA-3-methyladenine glycosylase I
MGRNASGKPARCPWPTDDPVMIAYHDTEWGVPVHDDARIFEFLVLETMQAGLSWSTILHKRESFRRAFDGFDVRRVAAYDGRKVGRLLADRGIIRNRLKIEATISNARRFIEVQEEFGSFDAYVWRFVGGKPKAGRLRTLDQMKPRTRESDAMSRDLKARGFKFVGSTICYAHMQATGMVNDHLVTCFRYRQLLEDFPERRRSGPGSATGTPQPRRRRARRA